MKFFYSPASPFARKARIIAIEKGVHDRLTLVLAAPLQSPPELLAVNPLMKVPALVLDDGRLIADSKVICEYLDSLSETPKFIPAAGEARWDALTRASVADGIAEAAVQMTWERQRPPAEQSEFWTLRRRQAIEQALQWFSSRVSTYRFDIGDIALVAALDYLNLRHPDLGWQERAPALRSWLTVFGARSSVVKTAPPQA